MQLNVQIEETLEQFQHLFKSKFVALYPCVLEIP